MLVQDGIFSNEEELKKYPHFSNTQPGDFRFVDVDGDGVMDLDKDPTEVIICPTSPMDLVVKHA